MAVSRWPLAVDRDLPFNLQPSTKEVDPSSFILHPLSGIAQIALPGNLLPLFFKRAKKPALPPEWLIVGLGNPGPEYSGTRHNVGFDVIDRLAAKHRIKVRSAKHRALFGEGDVEGTWVVIAKPLTYMNLSGNAVAALARQFGIQPQKVLVIADDLDLPVGTVRLRSKGSAGGHNGHKSIIEGLKTEEYPRIKIGIGTEDRDDAIDHVLSKFKPSERGQVDEAQEETVRAVEGVLREGLERTMGWVNAKEGREMSDKG